MASLYYGLIIPNLIYYTFFFFLYGLIYGSITSSIILPNLIYYTFFFFLYGLIILYTKKIF